jgi:N-acetylglucosamine kinase-like BadF-type ATPase
MSIKINTDLEYLLIRLNIPPTRAEQYQDKTIEEILDSEAAAGNQAAIKMAADMFTDVNQLIELFQLADPENKLAILGAMTESQLDKLVPMLETSCSHGRNNLFPWQKQTVSSIGTSCFQHRNKWKQVSL